MSTLWKAAATRQFLQGLYRARLSGHCTVAVVGNCGSVIVGPIPQGSGDRNWDPEGPDLSVQVREPLKATAQKLVVQASWEPETRTPPDN